MAKKKSDGAEPSTMAIKVDRALAKKAHLIAADKGITLADYVSGALRSIVEKDWGKMVRRVGEEDKG